MVRDLSSNACELSSDGLQVFSREIRMRVNKTVFNILLAFKVIWTTTVFLVGLYFIKAALGIDLIPGWSLFHV